MHPRRVASNRVNLAPPLTSVLFFAALIFFVPRPSLTGGLLSGAGDLDSHLPQPIGSSTPSAVRIPPRTGEVFDSDALRRSNTYCIDTSHLAAAQTAEVREFLGAGGETNKLLGRLPWKLVDDCKTADAVARIYFANSSVTLREEENGATIGSKSGRGLQAVLLIYDKASIRLFYRAEGQVLHGNPSEVLGSPFAMLAKDLKKIQR
jgi:hypothetical protein